MLVDTDDDEVYLGELNPRVSGISSMTNVSAGAYADIPLYLFHLLDYLGAEFDIDTAEINARWEELAAVDIWSQLILKTSTSDITLVTAAPRTGIYRMVEDGTLEYQRNTLDWHYLVDDNEAFFLRVSGPGSYLYKGADLGILVSKSRMQTEDGALTDRCRHYVDGIHALYESQPIAESARPTQQPFFALLK